MGDEVSLARMSTAAVPAAERFDFWQDSLSSTLQPVDIQPVRGYEGDFRAAFGCVATERSTIGSGTTDPVSSKVTVAHARVRDASNVLLSMQGTGRLDVEARGERTEFASHTLLVQADDEPTVHTRSARASVVLMSVRAADLSLPMARLRPLMFRPLRIDPSLSEMFARAAWAAQRSATGFDAVSLDAYLHGVAELLLRTVSGQQPEHAGTAALRRQQARDVIRARFSDPRLNSARVAQELGVSVRRLQQIFAGGDSLAQQIRDLRLSRAQELLRDPTHRNLPIAGLAAQCGFADHSTFSRAFRHATGISPRDFRV
ncbi:MAG: helix-turn-helix transcriptional regulator [Mycobacteriaceae bacterium]